MNDGLDNELEIVREYNNKKICNLTSSQRKVICVLGNFNDNDVIHAEKIKGNYKPDIEFQLKKNGYKISVKKGNGNSVHQERIDTFISFCEEYLDMPSIVSESLLYFLYGDGTIDGSGDLKDRLGNEEVKERYRHEIEIVNEFFENCAIDLLERFLIYGRFGKETGKIAEYLYHGTAYEGAICPLNKKSIEYLSKQEKKDESGIHVGLFNLQTWNRNLKGNPNYENRRDSIQIKCGIDFQTLIIDINEYIKNNNAKEQDDISNTHALLGDNSHGFRNQEYIIDSINGRCFKDLNSNLRNLVKIAFPEIKNKDIIFSEKIRDNKLKPKMKLSLNGDCKYFTIKMGSGNSVHQEKLEDFINFLYSMGFNKELEEVLRYFVYGDGTLDGFGRLRDRMNETQVIEKLGENILPLNLFFYNNRIKIAKRFLQYGAYSDLPSDYIYYGTENNGITVPFEKIMDYIYEYQPRNDHLYVGPLTIQTWNRNLSGKSDYEYKRNSIQVKWSTLDFDLKEVQMRNFDVSSKNGIQAEYEFVSLLNRIKSPSYSLWKDISSTLNINDLDNIYAIRVTERAYSKLSKQKVLPKSDLYLIKAKLDPEFLLSNNYWLDEEIIKNIDYQIIPNSGISCKMPDSKNFTFQKFTVDSFISLFKNPFIGAGISMFVNQTDVSLNDMIVEKWKIDKLSFKNYFEKSLSMKLDKDFILDVNICQLIKKYSTNCLQNIINNNTIYQDIIFKGKGIFNDPYWANFIYENRKMNINSIPNYLITNGSGRHKGNVTIIIKPK